ncbi:hypothetical protein [Algicola sagamiensis]|uniref:hypothetical protein n=1 Tax=Algicola sagamiensis TaxID=163869 RepID=UPI000377F8B7|nr:hypothetical protein [Algicola sagamiensis]
MKKIIIGIIVFISILVVIDHPSVGRIKSVIVDSINIFISDTTSMQSDKSLAAETLREVEPIIRDYTEAERDYVRDVLSSDSKAEGFLRNYCRRGDFNPNIHPDRASEVCSVLSRNARRLSK